MYESTSVWSVNEAMCLNRKIATLSQAFFHKEIAQQSNEMAEKLPLILFHGNFNSELSKDSSNLYLMMEILLIVVILSNSYLKWENEVIQLSKTETGVLSRYNN